MIREKRWCERENAEGCRKACRGVCGRGRRLVARQAIGWSAGRLRQIKSNRWNQRNANLQAFFLLLIRQGGESLTLPFASPTFCRGDFRTPSISLPPCSPFSFPSFLKGVRTVPFDGSMILLRHYQASQTPNCSAYSPYYLT